MDGKYKGDSFAKSNRKQHVVAAIPIGTCMFVFSICFRLLYIPYQWLLFDMYAYKYLNVMPCSLDLTLNGSLRFNRIISHWIAFSCNVFIVHNVYYILGNYFVCMFRICCATTHMFVKTFSHILWFVCLFVHDLIEWMCVYSSIWKFWFIENIHMYIYV